VTIDPKLSCVAGLRNARLRSKPLLLVLIGLYFIVTVWLVTGRAFFSSLRFRAGSMVLIAALFQTRLLKPAR